MNFEDLAPRLGAIGTPCTVRPLAWENAGRYQLPTNGV